MAYYNYLCLNLRNSKQVKCKYESIHMLICFNYF